MHNRGKTSLRENRRASGVLLPVFSLPGRYGCGSFGKEARSFIDLLAASGFLYWQVLPFGMTDEYGSPYASYGSFSGNPYFVDPELLYEEGLLTEEEVYRATVDAPYAVDYTTLSHERIPLLMRAAARVCDRAPIRAFMEAHPHIAAFCRYMALRDKHNGIPSALFPDDVPDPDRLFSWEFVQYTFFEQWSRVRAYANEHGVSIIGDLPIYVSLESADVYGDPRQFLLTKDGRPRMVAGVPPDDFTADGQLWGNPLYNWQEMKKDHYRWWRDRLSHMLMLFDGVRIDHFRGLDAYYAIPADAEDARGGRWQTGPGRPFIRAIKEVAGDALMIAEDLGNITPAVESLVRYSGFYATRVFQFAFEGDDDRHLPYRYHSEIAAYTGTHDNNTLLGYLMECDAERRECIRRYVGGIDTRAESLVCDARRVLLASHANLVIFPIQDLLVYGADTRINIPGRAAGNWRYRVTAEQLARLDSTLLYEENRRYGRI